MNSRIITSSSFHIPISQEHSNSSLYSNPNYIAEGGKPVFLLEWSNLNCILHSDNRDTILLNSVSGYANPGELTAIMGPSGSGKTTLLNRLAKRESRNRKAEFSGKVTLNSIDISKIHYFKYVGYVTQEDILLETFTPKEALLFAAQLKLSENMKYNNQRTQVLIASLHLSKVQNTLIGSPAQKKLSGGERRRVSIGIELISNLGILFLDEPTSGLDVQTADAIIEVLRSEARKGKTVIAIIHQPSYKSYKKFDKLIVMSEGNIIYHDSPSQAKKYFNNLGFRVPRSINPADHFMSLLHIRDRLHKTEYENNVLNNAIELYKGNQHVTEDQRFKEFKPGSIEERVYKASITIEMKVCLTRAFKNSYRNDAIFKGKIIQNLLECILFSIIFQDLSTDATGVQNRNGFLFFIIIPQLFETNQDTLMSSNLYSVPMERDLFFKEKAANMYSLASYILPKLITELPVLILLTIIYSSVIYWFVNLNPHFLNFTAFSKLYIATILILARVLGNTLGLLGGILFPTTTAALVLYPAVISPLIVYAGLLVNLNSIAVSFSWMKYISVRSTQPFYYAYEVLIINEYEDQELDCRVCEDDICKECDPISDLSINPENYIRNLAILSIFPVIILLLSSLLLYIKSQIHFN